MGLSSRWKEEGPLAWNEYVQALSSPFNEQAYEDPLADLTNLVQPSSLKNILINLIYF